MKPDAFNTITGRSWTVSLQGARARRKLHAELITTHCRELAEARKRKNNTMRDYPAPNRDDYNRYQRAGEIAHEARIEASRCHDLPTVPTADAKEGGE